MKEASKLAVLLSLGALAPFASAKSIEQTYLESYHKDSTVPVPIAVVSPRASTDAVGDKVDLEFTVEASGKPSKITVLSSTDDVFAATVISAVKQWQFTPAERNGVPVATKVILPVRVVDASAVSSYAAE
jgi:protein TonB